MATTCTLPWAAIGLEAAKVVAYCPSTPKREGVKAGFSAEKLRARKYLESAAPRVSLSCRRRAPGPCRVARTEVVTSQDAKTLEKDPVKLWERYTEWLYTDNELGISLDVSRMSFPDEFVEEMEPKFAKAFQHVAELERGAISNPDEKRMVGHYWLRAPELAPTAAIRQAIFKTIMDVEKFADDIISGIITPPPPSTEERFTCLLCVGIGGSALGPQFVAAALAPPDPPLKIFFIDNTDPAGIDHVMAQIGAELPSTLVVVTSKSGGTPETRNGLLEVQKVFRERGLNFAKQGVAITQENSLLDNTARGEGWIARFPMFDWVGGRTSELAGVGLLPAALQGIDIRGMLRGAGLMDKSTRVPIIRKNPAALMALSWYWATGGKAEKDMVVLPYKDRLLLISRYLQQLIMESIGKAVDLDGNKVNQGLTVYGNKGSTDQHAYVQQLRDGVHNFFTTFIEVLRDRQSGDWELEPGVTCGDYLFGMLLGTRSALYSNDRESMTVTLNDVTPETVGALVALFERTVSIYASLVNVNAYHQPGVEAGKKAAAEVLGLQKRVLQVLDEHSCQTEDPDPLTVEEVAFRCGSAKEIETIYKILSHMAANERIEFLDTTGHPGARRVDLPECPVLY